MLFQGGEQKITLLKNGKNESIAFRNESAKLNKSFCTQTCVPPNFYEFYSSPCSRSFHRCFLKGLFFCAVLCTYRTQQCHHKAVILTFAARLRMNSSYEICSSESGVMLLLMATDKGWPVGRTAE
jgi:hypothetical protein